MRREDKSEVVDNGSSRIGAGGERRAKATEAGDLGGGAAVSKRSWIRGIGKFLALLCWM